MRGLLLVLLFVVFAAASGEDVSEPEGLWSGPINSAVPATIIGGKVIQAKELARLNWEKWLFEVNSILKLVTLLELTDTKDAVPTVEKLLTLIGQLEQRDIH